MSRIAGLAVVAALLLTGVGVGPAYADPPLAPGVTLDPATAGHVTGTVTSDQPVVQVQLADNGPVQVVTLDNGTGTFDLETWGFDPATSVTVSAIACPGVPADGGCSSATTSESFTPVDPRPDVTVDDATVGPGQTASVTSTDADGGGVLRATWTPDVGTPVVTPLDRNGSTPISIADDGDGTVTVQRCANPPVDQCTGFAPAISLDLDVHRTMTASVSTISTITTTNPSSGFSVTTSRSGTATLAWHVATLADVQVGPDHPAAPGFSGTVDGTTISADGSYKVVGTITVDNPDYGTYSDVPFSSAAFTVDQHGPDVTSITRSAATVYPNVTGWAKYPAKTTITVNGGSADVVAVRITQGASTRTLPTSNGIAVWDGRVQNGAAVKGVFTVRALDALGNPSSATATILVDTRRIVTKTWTKLVTVKGSLAATFTGRCSTLKRPARRAWAGSVGYYANTRCGDRSWTGSAATTAHAILLPKVDQLLDIRVDSYGAAARSRPRSHGLIRYLTTSGNWVSIRSVGRRLGWHSGYTRSTPGVVFRDNSFGWSFATSAGNRYDTWKFRVVLHYKGLG